jgi:hypothetical protein
MKLEARGFLSNRTVRLLLIGRLNIGSMDGRNRVPIPSAAREFMLQPEKRTRGPVVMAQATGVV